MFGSDLCDHSNMYIVVKGTITVNVTVNAAGYNRKVILNNCTPFTACITKINNTFTSNAEDIDTVIPLHNLLEDNINYSKISESIWHYYRDGSNIPRTYLEAFNF